MTTTSENTPAVSVEGRKVTWSYTRKVGLGYGSEQVGLFVTDHVPEDTENIMEWVANKSEAAVDMIKAEVWAGLGLSFSYDGQGKPHLDKPKPPRPTDNGSQQAPPPPTQAPPPQPQGQAPSATPPPVGSPRGSGRGQQPSVAQVGYYAEFPGFCKECGAQGIDNFYDNRADVDGRINKREKIGPDFKCKNCANGLWRPGSYDYNEAIKKGQTPGQAQPQQTMPPPL